MSAGEIPVTGPLTYSIAGRSAHSGRYVAENIMVDCPFDHSSRWSGATPAPNANQWILLRLDSPAVVKSITFGKLHKPHPCNMKEFRLYVGLHENHLTEVLHSGLKNDPVPETFSITHINRRGICFPTRFIKIVPLSAHGQNYHTSIWFVSLGGIAEPSYVEKVSRIYDEYRETVILSHVLKHLRQRRLLTPFQSIRSRSTIQFEDPLVTSLYFNIVLQGDWSRAEALLSEASRAGLYDAYLQARQPRAKWTQLHAVDADGDAPSRRGGHAMCIDRGHGLIYLLGGWNGEKNLDDFWVYKIKEEQWQLLSDKTSAEKNGPVERACHKIVFDSKTGCIYLLGRLIDDGMSKQSDEEPPAAPTGGGEDSAAPNGQQPTTAYCSEFYRYHTRGLDAGKWDLLSWDTMTAGGPPLIFDHQMVMDSDAQMLYVFGGQVVDGDWDQRKYSGLYSYNVRTSKWRLLQPINASSSTSSANSIPPRSGHSMVLDCITRTLFIFAGQKDERYLSDMYAYDIATNTVTELFSNFNTNGGPQACFTQRAVIDPNLKEIYVFCGLTRTQPSSASLTFLRNDSPNWVYRYDIPSRSGTWTRILPELHDEEHANISSQAAHQESDQETEPRPRYAHQVVYDEGSKTVFLHGGNSGEGDIMEQMEGTSMSTGNEEVGDGEKSDDGTESRSKHHQNETRLDDFWRMTLQRAAPEEIIRQATYQIRKQQFREMCEEQSPVKALRFLQTEVSSVVDHNCPDETKEFRSLLAHLLSPPAPTTVSAYTHFNATAVSAMVGSSVSEDADADADSPPKKRSRSTTPDGSWTNQLDDDEIMIEESLFHASRADSLMDLGVGDKRDRAILMMDEDPLERASDDGGDAQPLSTERFKQRTEIFETLLQFIGDEHKQPSGTLLDLVDADHGL